jgi:octopine/nopaline transport system ATP-binding protein
LVNQQAINQWICIILTAMGCCGRFSSLEARQLFRAWPSVLRTEAEGASLHRYPDPLKVPKGEDLATDVAVLGSADAKHTSVINSGTHGVERAYGSACQTEFLKQLANTAPAVETNAVFIYLINPWGTAWARRVNDDSVDINRNFVDWSKIAGVQKKCSAVSVQKPQNPVISAISNDRISNSHNISQRGRKY